MLRGAYLIIAAPVLALLGAAFLLAGCGSTPWVHGFGVDDPLTGTIQDIAGQRTVDEAGLVEALDSADFILLGESPDNLDHRRLATDLVDQLGRGRPGLDAVAFEAIDTDEQSTLVEHLASGRDRGLRRLGAALNWERRGRAPYENFRPLLLAARSADAEIVAAGLPPLTVTTVMAGGLGALPPAFALRTGLVQPLPPLLAAELDQEILTAHCHQLAADIVNRIADTQRAADAGLADRLATLTGRGRGLLLASASHVRKDWGVPWYLEKLRPGAKIVSVVLAEVGEAAQMATEGVAYDYVWFTPGVRPPGRQPCRSPGGFIDQREANRHEAAARGRG